MKKLFAVFIVLMVNHSSFAYELCENSPNHMFKDLKNASDMISKASLDSFFEERGDQFSFASSICDAPYGGSLKKEESSKQFPEPSSGSQIDIKKFNQEYKNYYDSVECSGQLVNIPMIAKHNHPPCAYNGLPDLSSMKFSGLNIKKLVKPKIRTDSDSMMIIQYVYEVTDSSGNSRYVAIQTYRDRKFEGHIRLRGARTGQLVELKKASDGTFEVETSDPVKAQFTNGAICSFPYVPEAS